MCYLYSEAGGPVAADAVGEEGARAEVARDELLHVRRPDLVQRGHVGGGSGGLVVCMQICSVHK